MSSVLSRALGRRKPAPVGGTWPPRAPLTARKRRRMVRERVQRLIDEQERADRAAAADAAAATASAGDSEHCEGASDTRHIRSPSAAPFLTTPLGGSTMAELAGAMSPIFSPTGRRGHRAGQSAFASGVSGWGASNPAGAGVPVEAGALPRDAWSKPCNPVLASSVAELAERAGAIAEAADARRRPAVLAAAAEAACLAGDVRAVFEAHRALLEVAAAADGSPVVGLPAAQSRMVRALAMAGLTAVAVTSAGALLAGALSPLDGAEADGFRASLDGSAAPHLREATVDHDPDLDTLNTVLRAAGLRAERGAGCACHRCGEDTTYTAAAMAVARASRAAPGKRASDPGAATGGPGGGGAGVSYSVPCTACGSQMVPRLCLVPVAAGAADTADGVWVEVLGPAAIAREVRGVVARDGAVHGHLHRLREERPTLFWSACFSLVRAVAAGAPGESAALACGFVTDPPDDSWLASETELEAAAAAAADGATGSLGGRAGGADDEDSPCLLEQLTSPGGTALPGTVLLLPGYAAAMVSSAAAAVEAAARSPASATAADVPDSVAGALVPRWSVAPAGSGPGRASAASSARLPSLDRVGSGGSSPLRRTGSEHAGRMSIARPSPGRRMSRSRSRASLGASSNGSELRPLSIPAASSADRQSRRSSAMTDTITSPIVAGPMEHVQRPLRPVPRAAALAAAALSADVRSLRQQHEAFVQSMQQEAARAVRLAAERGAASVARYRAEAMVAKTELLRSRARVRVVVRVRPPRAGWIPAGGPAGGGLDDMAIVLPKADGRGAASVGGTAGPSGSGTETVRLRSTAGDGTAGAAADFAVDRMLGPSCSQSRVWDEAEPAVAHALQGGVGCVLAYGQTGSGKTHTMGLEDGAVRPTGGEGGGFAARAGRGVVPRALAMALEDPRVQSGELVVRVHAVEVHNDAVIDLLRGGVGQSAAGAGGGPGRGKPHAQHHNQRSGSSSIEGKIVPRRREGSVELPGATAIVVTCEADGARLLAAVAARRATSSTSMNASSSRSHCVVVLGLYRSRQSTESTSTAGARSVSSGALSQVIEDEADGDSLLPEGKLVLADLAGSERLKRTGAMDVAAADGSMGKQEAADRAKEAGAINKSLSALGNVMQALAKGDEARKAGGGAASGAGGAHVPWRDSLLTTVLADAVGPGAATVLLAAVAPDAADAPETLRTLQFAERARAVRAAGAAGAGSGASAKLKRRLKKTSVQLSDAQARIAALEDRLRRAEAAAAASGAKAIAAEAQAAAATAAVAATLASGSTQPSASAHGRPGLVVGEGCVEGGSHIRARATTSSSLESDVSASALGCPPSPIRVLDAAIAGAQSARPRRIASSPSLLDGRSPAGRLAATFLQRHQAALASPGTSAYALARMALWRGAESAGQAVTAVPAGARAASPPRAPVPTAAHSRSGTAGSASEVRTPVRRARRAAAGATRGAATPGSAVRSRYDMHGRRIKPEQTGFAAAPRSSKPKHVRTKSSSGSVCSDAPASPKAVPLSPTGRANAGGFRA